MLVCPSVGLLVGLSVGLSVVLSAVLSVFKSICLYVFCPLGVVKRLSFTFS